MWVFFFFGGGGGGGGTKYGWRIRKNINTFEAVVGVELLEGDKCAVCETYRYNIYFGKTPTSP